MIPYRKFSDALKNGNYALAPPKPPKAPKVGAADRTKIDALGGLGALGGLHPEIQKPAAAPEPELIAPSPWFECVARPAEGSPASSIPAPHAAAASETGMAYSCTFAPIAADGTLTAMASTFGQVGSVAGTALHIGPGAHPTPHERAA